MWKQPLDGCGVFLALPFWKSFSLTFQTVFTGLGCYIYPSHFPSWMDILVGHSITISLLDEDLEGHAIIFNDTDEHICCSLQPFTFLDIRFFSCAPDLKLIIQALYTPQELWSLTSKPQHVSFEIKGGWTFPQTQTFLTKSVSWEVGLSRSPGIVDW